MRTTRLLKMTRDIVLFIPVVIIGIFLHVFKDFKNHKAGYIVLFCFVSLVVFGFIMGIMAGPASPAPWDN